MADDPLPGLREHLAQDAVDDLELLAVRDERRRELDDGVAAIVRAADQPVLEELAGHEAAEELLRGFMSGELYKHGLICRADDRGDPVIQLSPPLIADTEEFELIDKVLREVLTDAWDRIVRH